MELYNKIQLTVCFMNRLYCISYLGRVESKWCNTVKHNNNLIDTITSVLLIVFLHNDFPGKTNFLTHRDFISLAPLSEHKQLFSCKAKVRGHVQYTHKHTRTNTCTQLMDTHMHTHIHVQTSHVQKFWCSGDVESYSNSLRLRYFFVHFCLLVYDIFQ